MNNCNVENCDVSCSGPGVDSSLSSSSKTVDGVTVHVNRANFLIQNRFLRTIFKGVTFNPKGSSGATCDMKCKGFNFKTTCQKSSGGNFAWTIPDTLSTTCGKLVSTLN